MLIRTKRLREWPVVPVVLLPGVPEPEVSVIPEAWLHGLSVPSHAQSADCEHDSSTTTRNKWKQTNKKNPIIFKYKIILIILWKINDICILLQYRTFYQTKKSQAHPFIKILEDVSFHYLYT